MEKIANYKEELTTLYSMVRNVKTRLLEITDICCLDMTEQEEEDFETVDGYLEKVKDILDKYKK